MRFNTFCPVLHWERWNCWSGPFWFLFIAFIIRNKFIWIQRAILYLINMSLVSTWAHGLYYSNSWRFTDVLLKADYIWNGEGGREYIPHASEVHLCMHFIYFLILRLILNVNLVTQRQWLFCGLGLVKGVSPGLECWWLSKVDFVLCSFYLRADGYA